MTWHHTFCEALNRTKWS